MDPYTSADCFDSLSKGSPYVSQEECDKLFKQENGFDCDTGEHWEAPIENICPQCITAPCPCGSCMPDQPLGGELLSEAEQFCQDKTNTMDWADVDPNPAKEDFYSTCVDEQNALLPEGLEEGVKIEPLTAGVGKDNMVLWVILAGASLWFLHQKGFFKKL